MESRKACWYSIVRYCANELTGEVVNVGVILHSIEEKALIKYQLISENSPKIRAITDSQVEVNIYKTFKDALEYYMTKNTENLLGIVGDVQIGSLMDEKFLDKLYEHYKDKKLFLSRPKFSLTRNLEGVFRSLFETYVGISYLETEHKEVSTKRLLKGLFEEKKLLDRKVMQDFSITPIKDLDIIKINIDFGYKNGVWNYLQAIPYIGGPSKNTEWLAKTKFMFENIENDTKVHLMYKSSNIENMEDFMGVLNYLSSLDANRILKLDLDDTRKVLELCDVIERDAHDIDELLIS
ncbi:DUF3037 domain-containing protein [Pseudobacillus wudalianchiensis]|uniref:DUF3037 domain-containing protein n=1 Tax=Pseudobacillus wudalianchiensis TaxID=1743143 RepID=A0A1B9ATQ9_9BACI|nr:DUF3037 domain-containing protein [Bacillus wudalianchiensis]OCA87272.1 hypothetical protein A8F95_08465 [Bacillus wudalianchiensis]